MYVAKWLAYLFMFLSVVASAAYGEIIIVTIPLPDLNGDAWPREYSDVDHAFFDIPLGVTIHAGVNPSPIRPNVTRHTSTIHGRTNVLDAWVNIIDIANSRYYAGEFGRWFDLDSTELIQIRAGFDTCAVYLRSCPRRGAPPDSCRTLRTMLDENFSISDVAYIIFTSFDGLDDIDRKIAAKSGNYFRKILGYLVRDVDLDQIIDWSSAGAISWPAGCSCMSNFSATSIKRVEYTSELNSD